MKSLREIILSAREKGVAVGHFNISNIEGLWAIFNSARELEVPVIIGLSEGEREFVGINQAVALVKSIREEYDYPIFINADHTYSYEKVVEAVDAGVDSVIFDGAKLSIGENIEITKKCVDYGKRSGRDVLVEGELGYIGTSSALLDKIPDGASVSEDMFTKVEEAKEYVKKTGVDLLAPAVGNLHGILKNSKNPALSIKRIKELAEICSVPLVLHGGSGIERQDFIDAIKNGMSVVHVNTELREAYRDSLKKSLEENPNEVAPYRIMKPVVESMEEVVEDKLKLFNRI